jgi:hypothetical protein
MPFLYAVAGLAANASYATHATPSTEDPTLSLRQVTAQRGFDVTGAYCNGRASAATTISGISYVARRWTTAGSGGTTVTPAPRRIGTTASGHTAHDKASALTAGTVSGAIQFSMGCGKAGPGGWVARDADSTVHIEAQSVDELCIASLSAEASQPHYVWCETAE